MQASELELQQVRDRELELKRLAGEISCAEYSSSGVIGSCNVQIPCCSCIRRGFKDICPTGTSTGDGVRRSTTTGPSCSNSTDQIENPTRTSVLCSRIAALEDALQFAVGPTHPLLSSDMLSIKGRFGSVGTSLENAGDVYGEQELDAAFGTLTIGEGRAMQFLGASASENVFLMGALQDAPVSVPVDFSKLPVNLMQLSEMWPFVPAQLSHESKLFQLGACLPSYDRASQLVKAYFSRPVWFVDRSQVQDDLIGYFYPQGRPLLPTSLKTGHMHDLALLFIIFAGGSLADSAQKTLTSPEAERYYHLTRAALSLNNIFENGSLSACQALILLGSYDTQSGRKTSPETSWKLGGLGFLLAISIGLHRDPTHWNLGPDESDRRRLIFWELYTADKWKCLGTGRPPLFPLHAIDCEFPRDPGITLGDGSKGESVRQWKYRFSRDVLTHVANHFSSAKTHKYSEIIRLDKLVRDFPVHPFVSHAINSAHPLGVDQLSFHPLFSVWWKERALLYVHRGYFARAILGHGIDPMRSPFSSSFIGAYRSASALLKATRLALEHRSELKLNTPFWAMSLSASIIIGSVAANASSSFTTSAFSELEFAILLFRSSDHPVATHGLSVLSKLRDRAIAASNDSSPQNHLQGPLQTNGAGSSGGAGTYTNCSDDEEELHVMRGTTRRIERLGRNMTSQTDSEAFVERSGRSFRSSDTLAIGPVNPTGDTSTSSLFSKTPGIYASYVFGDYSVTSPHHVRSSLGDQGIRAMPQGGSIILETIPTRDHTHDRLTTSNATSVLDLAFEDVLAAEYMGTNYSTSDTFQQSAIASDAPFDIEDVRPLSHQSGRDVEVSSHDDPAAIDLEGGVDCEDLWHSFIQQLSSSDGTDPALVDWDTMELV